MLQDSTDDPIKEMIKTCQRIYVEFFWLIDSYVLDFFIDNHWQKLPESWMNFFNDMQPANLASILDINNKLKTSKVVPLAMIALRKLLQTYNLPRRNLNCKSDSITNINTEKINNIKEDLILYKDLHKDSKILKLFWKYVKPKKRHEINIMAEETFETAVECDCKYIIDIGSGLGHLTRLLSYGYGLNVCGIELQEKLSTQAKELDTKFEITAAKYYENFHEFKSQPIHINLKIEPNTKPKDFVNVIKEAFHIRDVNFKFGIIGLHPCGDLGATLLRLFNNCENCKFINLVSCCYMKLTTKENGPLYGYPISKFCRKQDISLSYNSREIACHSIETYVDRLKAGYHWELKIHAFRAIIEKLIVRKWPHMKHLPLSNVKYTEDLTFTNYCLKALKKFNNIIENDLIETEEINDHLNDWLNVVVFYTLRLQMAPMIETIILLDRLLYIKENGAKFYIKSAFEPKLSPRNFIITAIKSSEI